jgi:tape measure domain-containing protein
MADKNKISITVDLDTKQAQKGVEAMTSVLKTFGTEGKAVVKNTTAMAAGTEKGAAAMKDLTSSTKAATTAFTKLGQTDKAITTMHQNLRIVNSETRMAATTMGQLQTAGAGVVQTMKQVGSSTQQAMKSVAATSQQATKQVQTATTQMVSAFVKADAAAASLGTASKGGSSALRSLETRATNTGAALSNLRKEAQSFVGVTGKVVQSNNQMARSVSQVSTQVNHLTNVWNTQRAAMIRTQQAQGNLANSFRAIRGLDFTFQGALLGGGALMATEKILETAASIDKLKKSLESLAPAGTNVQALFDRLMKLAEMPGGDIEAIFAGVTALMPGFQYKTEAVVKTVEELQNALALTGKGGQELTLVLNQLAQASGKGKVAMEDFRYIFQQIPQARAIISAKYGTSDLEELTKKGIGFFKVMLTLVEGAEQLQRAQAGIAVEMQKVRNQIKLLTSDLGNLLAKEIPFKTITGNLKEVRDAIEKMPPWLKEMGAQAVIAAGGFLLLAGAVTLIATVVGGLASLKIAAWIVGIGVVVKTLIDDLKDMYVILKAIVPYITSAKGKGTTFESIAVKEYDKSKGTPTGVKMGTAEAEAAKKQLGLDLKGVPAPPEGWDDRLRQPVSKGIQELRRLAEQEEAMNKARADGRKGSKADPFAAFAEQAARARDAALAKEGGALGGIEERYAKHFREFQKLITSTTKLTAEQGFLMLKAYGDLQQAMEADLRKEQTKLAQAQIDQMSKYLEDAEAERQKKSKEAFDKAQEWRKATYEMERQQLRDSIEARIDIVGYEADQARARAAGLPKETMNQRIIAAKVLADIEIQEAQRVHEYKLILMNDEFNQQELMAVAEMNDARELADRLWAIKQARELANARMKASTDATIAKRELDAMAQIQDAIRDNYRKTYEQIKDSAGRVFDALLDKSTSFFDAFANMFKTAVLTAMKEVVSSQIARLFTRIVVSAQTPGQAPGATPPFIPSTQGTTRSAGIMRTLGGLVSSVGGFFRGGSTSGGGSARTSDFFPAGPNSMFGGPGPGVLTSTLPTIVTMGTRVNPYAQMAALGGAAIGAQGIQQGGPLGAAQGIGGFALSGAMLGKLGIPALSKFGGWTGAGIGAGVGLMAAGANQSNPVARYGMTVGGGILAGGLLGAKIGAIGGPWGMAIGAAAGVTIGLIASLRKTAEQKVREEVKRVYGVDISSKGILQQIAGIAKNTYGGDIRLAVASPQVQELVRLYSMTTGQSQAGLPRQMHAATFAQQGGSMTLQPVYSGGQPVPNPYVGTTTGQFNQGVLIVPVGASEIQAQFTGNVVNALGSSAGPGAVSYANSQAIQSGNGRQAQATGLMEPLTAVR